MESAEFYVNKLNMQPLWTTDFLSEVYHSPVKIPESVLPRGFSGSRSIFNWAYYLIPQGCICPFHRLYAEASWHYCAGGPLDILIIEEKNKIRKVRIGKGLDKGEGFLHIIPSNKWFAAVTREGSPFTLITICVSPGFELGDEERGYYETIKEIIPEHREIARKLSWPEEA